MASESLNLDDLNTEFESQSPQEILNWSWSTFQSDIALSSSFQTQSVPLLHMIFQVCPDIPILFLDTGYHFPETLSFRDELVRKWGLNVESLSPDSGAKQHLENPVEPLYRRDPDLCCRINKVEPMMRALGGLTAWVTGIRRDQTTQRENVKIIERRPNGLIKINPLANWTRHDIWKYMNRYALPHHSLFPQGYMSIGCAPCTRPVYDGDFERDGRWKDTSKKECGLHSIKFSKRLVASYPETDER